MADGGHCLEVFGFPFLHRATRRPFRTVSANDLGRYGATLADEAIYDEPATQLRVLRQVRSDLREALAGKRARLDEYGRTIPIVAEAEEGVSGAEAELERVMGLDRTLTTTKEYLTQAQDKIHRTLAPPAS